MNLIISILSTDDNQGSLTMKFNKFIVAALALLLVFLILLTLNF